MIEKYFLDFFFQKFLIKIDGKTLNWINMKLKVLKWMKVKLDDWDDFWKNLKYEFCIF